MHTAFKRHVLSQMITAGKLGVLRIHLCKLMCEIILQTMHCVTQD